MISVTNPSCISGSCRKESAVPPIQLLNFWMPLPKDTNSSSIETPVTISGLRMGR